VAAFLEPLKHDFGDVPRATALAGAGGIVFNSAGSSFARVGGRDKKIQKGKRDAGKNPGRSAGKHRSSRLAGIVTAVFGKVARQTKKWKAPLICTTPPE